MGAPFYSLKREVMRFIRHASQRRAPELLMWLSFALLPVLHACSDFKPVDLLNATIPNFDHTLSEDISYGAESRQVVEIYHPSEPADNHLLIVFVYGGAWRDGSRSEYEFVGQALSSAEHSVVIPDYRLCPVVRASDSA